MKNVVKTIAFCGIDGCGKSTQVNILNDHLISTGQKVVVVKAQFTPFHQYDNIQSEELLTHATAFEFVRNHLTCQPKEDEYDYIINDRHKLCYLALANVYGIEELNELKRIYSIVEHPDLLVYFNLSVTVAMDRLLQRKKPLTRRESYEGLLKFKEGYEKLLNEHYYKEMVIIDAAQALDDVTQQIKTKVISKL